MTYAVICLFLRFYWISHMALSSKHSNMSLASYESFLPSSHLPSGATHSWWHDSKWEGKVRWGVLCVWIFLTLPCLTSFIYYLLFECWLCNGLSFNPSAVVKTVPILPVSRVIISGVGKQIFKLLVFKTGKPPSFATIPISFHSVDSVRKWCGQRVNTRDHRIQA